MPLELECNFAPIGRIQDPYGITQSQVFLGVAAAREQKPDTTFRYFKSDTFDFSVEVDQDSNYIVIAKNKITETEYRYSVDPSNGSYYAID